MAERSAAERIHVAVRGDIPYLAHRWAVSVVERAVRHEAWPLRRAGVTLTRPPSLTAPCTAEIVADLGGHSFRVHGEARDPHTALELAAERLHRQAAALHAGEETTRRARAGGGDRLS